MTEVTREAEETLRGVSVGDAPLLERLLAMQLDNLEISGLDPRTYSLVKIATLIAIDAPPASYVAQVAFAREAGVTTDEIIGVLVASAPQVGIPKVVAAAPEIMLALDLPIGDEE
jgi:alkylhydroperoxidase/carboxymuconolactone decarboxylase family protein YurZ